MPGELLYDADWRNGQSSWRGWSWSAVDGMLVTDGADDTLPSVVAPIDLSSVLDFSVR